MPRLFAKPPFDFRTASGKLVDAAAAVVPEVIATVVGVISKVGEHARATMPDFAAAYDLTVFNPQLLCGVFIGAMMNR